MNAQHFDVAVVGGGIMGLANAWMAARRGLRVVLFERTAVAEGASVRNFGMVWPIGQPAGALYDTALRSRDFWVELGNQGVLEVETCGSIHLAHHDDELAVLEEFCAQKQHDCRMMSASEVAEHSSLANPVNLQGGMYSPTECRVNPRVASARIAAWLAEQQSVTCHFSTSIVRIEEKTLTSADGQQWTADQIVICSGSDLQTLYPEVLQQSGLKLCKLQMLKVHAPRQEKTSAVHLASGLTLRHYTSFQSTASLTRLQARISEQFPELDRFGIHVMASHFPSGDLILGDSHEYGDDLSPFDKAEIDQLMLRELRKVIQLNDWTVREHWHGIYAKHPELPCFEAAPAEGIHVLVGPGGAGMTMSFGLADLAWQRWSKE